MTRKIAVITGGRAEYGLLFWLMREIEADPRLTLQLVVTGMHLLPEFGSTIDDIRRDGFPIAEIVESQFASDDKAGMARSLGAGTLAMTDAFLRLAPDIAVVLGDRYEILAAAQSAALLGIPVAHISGGEVTEGAVDDWIRHSITKASWWHFTAAESYRKRVIQLGEDPARVFNVGDPGLDSVRRITPATRAQLEQILDLPLSSPLFLVTYHPATLGELPPETAFAELLSSLDLFPAATIILTKPNADAGGRKLASMADEYAYRNPGRVKCVASLGQRNYLSLMRIADVVIGNSSSGIVEAPPLKVATVNIGTRQDGRLRASSILDCPERADAITAAIRQALSPGFRAGLEHTVSLYGDCDASMAIREILATAVLPTILAKKFYDA